MGRDRSQHFCVRRGRPTRPRVRERGARVIATERGAGDEAKRRRFCGVENEARARRAQSNTRAHGNRNTSRHAHIPGSKRHAPSRRGASGVRAAAGASRSAATFETIKSSPAATPRAATPASSRRTARRLRASHRLILSLLARATRQLPRKRTVAFCVTVELQPVEVLERTTQVCRRDRGRSTARSARCRALHGLYLAAPFGTACPRDACAARPTPWASIQQDGTTPQFSERALTRTALRR